MASERQYGASLLCRLRRARGWSWADQARHLRALARRLHYTRITATSVASIQRTIARWESGTTTPSEQYRTLLGHAYGHTRVGAVSLGPGSDFAELLDALGHLGVPAGRLDELAGEVTAMLTEPGPGLPAALGTPVDFEAWADDLERAIVYLSRQNFPAATGLLDRWLARFAIDQLDAEGRYLHARSLALLGDTQRDQGAVAGLRAAQRAYRRALGVFGDLDLPRRMAQVTLSLVVVDEMAGDLRGAVRSYRLLGADKRLSCRDRARSRLWMGTSLSKAGQHEHAALVMAEATAAFEELDEAEDWSVAHQKLALAYRGAGDLDQAMHFIEAARSSGTDETPMQRVRLNTAHAHILLSDRATRAEGITLIEETARLAWSWGLNHQRRSIDAIRQGFQHRGGGIGR